MSQLHTSRFLVSGRSSRVLICFVSFFTKSDKKSTSTYFYLLVGISGWHDILVGICMSQLHTSRNRPFDAQSTGGASAVRAYRAWEGSNLLL